jgi:hypothetical protein
MGMDFQQRAARLKALAAYLNERKEQLYAISLTPARRAATAGSTSKAGPERCMHMRRSAAPSCRRAT